MINERSRYNRTFQIQTRDEIGEPTRRPYWVNWQQSRRTVYYDNREVQLKEGDTWHNLAFDYLGDSFLWWVICDWNQIVNPWKELRDGIAVGRRIQIPSVSRLNLQILGQ